MASLVLEPYPQSLSVAIPTLSDRPSPTLHSVYDGNASQAPALSPTMMECQCKMSRIGQPPDNVWIEWITPSLLTQFRDNPKKMLNDNLLNAFIESLATVHASDPILFLRTSDLKNLYPSSSNDPQRSPVLETPWRTILRRDVSKIVVPIYHTSHWTLCVMDFHSSRTYFYDSLRPNNNNINAAMGIILALHCELQTFLKHRCQSRHCRKLDFVDLKKGISSPALGFERMLCPKQKNSVDCGFHTMLSIRHAIEGGEFITKDVRAVAIKQLQNFMDRHSGRSTDHDSKTGCKSDMDSSALLSKRIVTISRLPSTLTEPGSILSDESIVDLSLGLDAQPASQRNKLCQNMVSQDFQFSTHEVEGNTSLISDDPHYSERRLPTPATVALNSLLSKLSREPPKAGLIETEKGDRCPKDRQPFISPATKGEACPEMPDDEKLIQTVLKWDVEKLHQVIDAFRRLRPEDYEDFHKGLPPPLKVAESPLQHTSTSSPHRTHFSPTTPRSPSYSAIRLSLGNLSTPEPTCSRSSKGDQDRIYSPSHSEKSIHPSIPEPTCSHSSKDDQSRNRSPSHSEKSTRPSIPEPTCSHSSKDDQGRRSCSLSHSEKSTRPFIPEPTCSHSSKDDQDRSCSPSHSEKSTQIKAQTEDVKRTLSLSIISDTNQGNNPLALSFPASVSLSTASHAPTTFSQATTERPYSIFPDIESMHGEPPDNINSILRPTSLPDSHIRRVSNSTDQPNLDFPQDDLNIGINSFSPSPEDQITNGDETSILLGEEAASGWCVSQNIRGKPTTAPTTFTDDKVLDEDEESIIDSLDSVTASKRKRAELPISDIVPIKRRRQLSSDKAFRTSIRAKIPSCFQASSPGPSESAEDHDAEIELKANQHELEQQRPDHEGSQIADPSISARSSPTPSAHPKNPRPCLLSLTPNEIPQFVTQVIHEFELQREQYIPRQLRSQGLEPKSPSELCHHIWQLYHTIWIAHYNKARHTRNPSENLAKQLRYLVHTIYSFADGHTALKCHSIIDSLRNQQGLKNSMDLKRLSNHFKDMPETERFSAFTNVLRAELELPHILKFYRRVTQHEWYRYIHTQLPLDHQPYSESLAQDNTSGSQATDSLPDSSSLATPTNIKLFISRRLPKQTGQKKVRELCKDERDGAKWHILWKELGEGDAIFIVFAMSLLKQADMTPDKFLVEIWPVISNLLRFTWGANAIDDLLMSLNERLSLLREQDPHDPTGILSQERLKSSKLNLEDGVDQKPISQSWYHQEVQRYWKTLDQIDNAD